MMVASLSIPYIFKENPMTEGNFKSSLKKKIEERFPGSIVTQLDPNYIQGIPDLLILYKKKWATLEVKRSKSAKHRPNQDYYIQKMNDMSFSSFIYPENEEEVLDALERSFKGHKKGRSCIPGSK